MAVTVSHIVMIISIRGIGWITKGEYGCVRTGVHRDHDAAEGLDAVMKSDIFSYPVKNYGRFDPVSKMSCTAVALALKDADIVYAAGRKQDIGIIGTNAEGSLRSDIEYFRDYLAGGRKLSRANLFIYTLPSSPLGEAAIHFGLLDRKSTRLNSSHQLISYAVFCLKKKK